MKHVKEENQNVGHLEEGARPFVTEARYLLERPQRDPDGGSPLLVALHGQGMSAYSFHRILRHLGRRPRTLLVPEGPYPFEKRSEAGIEVGYGWYIYTGDQGAFRAHLEHSERHVVGLVKEICESHPIDRSRITLLGYSQGGYLAGFIALRQRDLFRGLVLASTRLKHEFLEDEIRAGDLPATLFVHSESDPALPWDRVSEGTKLLRQPPHRG